MTKECLPCKIQTSSLGQRSIPIQIPRGFAPRDLDWNWDLCPRDSVWILQGKHSFVIGFPQSMQVAHLLGIENPNHWVRSPYKRLVNLITNF